VREVRVEQTRIALAGLTDTWMTQVTRAGVSGAELQRVLKPVIDKRAELATLDRRLNDLQMELQTITADQQRLRENMKALRGSTEEKQLLQRYTHQLDAQETRLDALKGDMTKTSDARTMSQMELASLISTLNFDLSGGQ
jgi:chromosome segregation ATPase